MAFERTKVIKGRKYRYLVENYRDPQTGKVRQRVLQYLGPGGDKDGEGASLPSPKES
jgi:hypothetical protein